MPGDEVIEEVLAVAAGDRWVLDGNFDSHRQRLWPLADLVVWLDLPRTTVLRAVTIRNLGSFIGRRVVWAGNRMTLRSAASGIRHANTTYATKRERYPTWLAELGVDHVRLRSRKEIEHWVETIPDLSRGHAGSPETG